MPDEEELVCGIALMEQELPCVETMVLRASRKQLAVLFGESCEKWVLTQNALKSLHWSPPCWLQGLS